jgi:hypothetical protein
MKNKVIYLSGAFAALLYAVTVILGGLIRPGYSHISQAISELIEAGAADKRFLDPLFILYNVLTGVFGSVLTSKGIKEKNRAFIASGAAFLVEAISGVIMTLFYPMDPRGAAPTFAGKMHLIIAGIMSLFTMVAVGCAAAGFRENGKMRIYSIISLAVIFISGATAAWGAATANPLLGIFERVTIGAYLQWMLVISVKLQNK